ncbi:transposable element Tcb2 transposase [Trichonephila clavipes]|nr:transposable element Tcb2 transposase [Trichonephila clavipes]
MLNGRTKLHIFDRGSVIGDRYCEEVLLPHVRLFRGVIGPDFIFMDDYAAHFGLLLLRSCWKEKISLEWIGQRITSHRTCVGCFGETYCSTFTSSGEHPTTQTDAD